MSAFTPQNARRDCGKASYDDLGMCDHRPKHHSLSWIEAEARRTQLCYLVV
jgi:hypothetical protein